MLYLYVVTNNGLKRLGYESNMGTPTWFNSPYVDNNKSYVNFYMNGKERFVLLRKFTSTNDYNDRLVAKM